MTKEMAQSMDRWLKWAQFCVALTALIAALTYAGQRSERDEQQTRSLERMAVEMGEIRKEAQQGSQEARVLTERLRGLEERVTRIERR
jgi:hypothetical protein